MDAGIAPEGEFAGHSNDDRNEGQGKGGGTGNEHGEQGATEDGTGGTQDGKGEKERLSQLMQILGTYVCRRMKDYTV